MRCWRRILPLSDGARERAKEPSTDQRCGATQTGAGTSLEALGGGVDRHIGDFCLDFDGGSFSGNTPPNVAPIIANAGASYRYVGWWWPVEVGASVRHVGRRYLWDDNAVVMDAYTVADAFIFVDFEKPRMLPTVEKTRLAFRVRNLTNKVYAAFSDPGYPDQVYLGAPRTYEAALSFKF
jgi:outer membrane receptor protein involved in Fe transport